MQIGTRNFRYVVFAIPVGLLVLTVLLVGTLTFLTSGGCACHEHIRVAEFEQTDVTSSTVSITHNGGDDIYAGNLLLGVDGEKTPLSAVSPAYNETELVTTGDSFTLSGVSPGDVVEIVYTDRLDTRPTENDTSATIAEISVSSS